MAQRRMLSKRISQSKKVNRLPLKAQVVWTWTIPYLDDYGCYTGDSEDIKTEVFPKNKKISQKDIEKALGAEVEAGLIVWYSIGNGELVQQYRNFDDFQTFKSDRPKISEYPQYQPNNEGCVPVGNQKIPEGSLSKVKLREENLSKEKSKYISIFDQARKEFYGTKRGLQTEFDNFRKKHKDWEKVLPLLLPAIKTQIANRLRMKLKNEFVPPPKNFKTWINQRCWEESTPDSQPAQLEYKCCVCGAGYKGAGREFIVVSNEQFCGKECRLKKLGW